MKFITYYQIKNLTSRQHFFREKLAHWVVQFQITQAATNSLLLLLNDYFPIANLPNNAKTLVKTPRNIDIQNNDGCQYWHYGLTKVLNNALCNQTIKNTILSLNINVDGLPMFRSSTINFWPILVNIHELREEIQPLIVGIYSGKRNYNLLYSNILIIFILTSHCFHRLSIAGLNVRFRIRCFICEKKKKKNFSQSRFPITF